MFKVMLYLMYKLNRLQINVLKVSVFSTETQNRIKCLSQMDIFTSYDTFSTNGGDRKSVV